MGSQSQHGPRKRNMSLQSVLLLATLCGFASALVFEDASTDGVVVESSAIPAGDPNVDTRLLGGLLGGIKKKELCLINCGPGNPALSYQCCSFGYAQCCYGNAGGRLRRSETGQVSRIAGIGNQRAGRRRSLRRSWLRKRSLRRSRLRRCWIRRISRWILQRLSSNWTHSNRFQSWLRWYLPQR